LFKHPTTLSSSNCNSFLSHYMGGEMNQALYAHMNNKRKRKKNKSLYYITYLMQLHYREPKPKSVTPLPKY
jgi:hypothetical protein